MPPSAPAVRPPAGNTGSAADSSATDPSATDSSAADPSGSDRPGTRRPGTGPATSPTAPAWSALVGAFAAVRAARGSGTLHLLGNPGGVFRFTDGRAIAAESPGTPGLEALLLRGGRISEDDWARARRLDGAAGRLTDELVRSGLLSRPELARLARSVLYDAAFAVGCGTVTSQRWHADQGPTEGPNGREGATAADASDASRAARDGRADGPAAEPDWTAGLAAVPADRVAAEALRRGTALARRAGGLSPARDRIAASAPGTARTAGAARAAGTAGASAKAAGAGASASGTAIAAARPGVPSGAAPDAPAAADAFAPVPARGAVRAPVRDGEHSAAAATGPEASTATRRSPAVVLTEPQTPRDARGDATAARLPRHARPQRLAQRLLDHADGRRTVRDLAFVVGRGLYAVSMETARLRAAGLVAVVPASAAPTRAHAPSGTPVALAVRTAVPSSPGSGPDSTAHPAGGTTPLPRRRPGAGSAARSG